MAKHVPTKHHTQHIYDNFSPSSTLQAATPQYRASNDKPTHLHDENPYYRLMAFLILTPKGHHGKLSHIVVSAFNSNILILWNGFQGNEDHSLPCYNQAIAYLPWWSWGWCRCRHRAGVCGECLGRATHSCRVSWRVGLQNWSMILIRK